MLRTPQVTLPHLDLATLMLGPPDARSDASSSMARHRESERLKAASKYEQHAGVGTAARVLAATRSRRAGLFDRHDVQPDPLGTAQHNQRQRDADPLVDQPAVQVVNSGHGVAADVDDDVALA